MVSKNVKYYSKLHEVMWLYLSRSVIFLDMNFKNKFVKDYKL